MSVNACNSPSCLQDLNACALRIPPCPGHLGSTGFATLSFGAELNAWRLFGPPTNHHGLQCAGWLRWTQELTLLILRLPLVRLPHLFFGTKHRMLRKRFRLLKRIFLGKQSRNGSGTPQNPLKKSNKTEWGNAGELRVSEAPTSDHSDMSW